MSDQADGLRKAMAAKADDGAMRAAKDVHEIYMIKLRSIYPHHAWVMPPEIRFEVAQIIREETAEPEMLETLEEVHRILSAAGNWPILTALTETAIAKTRAANASMVGVTDE